MLLEDGESCYSDEVAPASQSVSPSISGSPPPPLPPAVIAPPPGRWADLVDVRRESHHRMQVAAAMARYGEPDACQKCSRRFSSLRRQNSCKSDYSTATTFNSYTHNSYGYKGDAGGRATPGSRARVPTAAEDEDSCPVICEREMHSLHRNVPALRRRDVDTTTIRQHYYPEGGWGWIICGAGFMAHLLTSGLQLSYGLLCIYTLHHLGEASIMDAVWVGSLCFAVSLFTAPLVVGLCRRKSTRLSAIFGGLVMALACLFTSFAQQLHQILLSYGVVMGIGAGLVRETSSLMLGHYFKRRREFVEMVVQAGGGVGIALFSVFYKEAVGKLGWRLGLQAVTGVLATGFFVGVLYRSASLYHPQRRAIVHLKNQRKKIKEKKQMRTRVEKPPFIDLSPLRIRTVQMLLLATGTAALGIYTPIFYLALQGHEEGLEDSALVLMQTFLGFATAVGCVGFGLVVVRPSEQCLISRQYLCQAAMVGIGISLLALGTVQGYHGYVLFVWLYGICLGGFLYSLKMFTMERVRSRYFTRTWGFVQGVEAIPVLLGVPITGYINQSHPRAGYYFSFLFTMVGAVLFFFVGYTKRTESSAFTPLPSAISDLCSCPAASPPPRLALPKSMSFATTLDYPDAPLGSISEEAYPENLVLRYEYMRNPPYHGHQALRPSKSVPEGLGRYEWQPRPVRQITVIEQMTTSV